LELKQQLPDATHLQLAFISNGGGLSHGTATTMAQRIGEKAVIRENGTFVIKPLGFKGMWLTVANKQRFVMSLQWGDISTAHHTTGIPNIEVFTGMQPKTYRLLKFQFLFNWLLRTKFIRNIIQQKINERPAGPTDEQRANGSTIVWGKVWNAKGEEKTSVLQCADGYSVTAWGNLLITQKILQGNWKAGYQTPASAYGKELVFEIPGSKGYKKRSGTCRRQQTKQTCGQFIFTAAYSFFLFIKIVVVNKRNNAGIGCVIQYSNGTKSPSKISIFIQINLPVTITALSGAKLFATVGFCI
jgi:short subunit dehydrogenase-like uncharacterized protein